MLSQLFSPITLGTLSIDNRIVVAPMCQYSAQDGNATDWHRIHLGNMALSGAGVVILEATAVEPIGRITQGCLGLWCDQNEAALKPVIANMRAISPSKIFIQLAHAGRKASSARPWEGGQQLPQAQGGWLTQAPSAIPHAVGEEPPTAFEAADLQRIKLAFVDSARRAVRLGLDGIELHAAHGYLLHQFLSPIANQRTDAYGGSLQNRMRFVLEVFDAVKAAIPADVVLGVRVSATDWVEGGWDLAQSIELAKALKGRGCDFIDVSSGGVSPAQKIPMGPGYQVPLAQAIRAATQMPTMAVGLITEPQQAEDILLQNQADMVALARGMLFDPRWGWHAAAALGDTVEAPPQYWRSQPRGLEKLFKNAKIGAR